MPIALRNVADIVATLFYTMNVQEQSRWASRYTMYTMIVYVQEIVGKSGAPSRVPPLHGQQWSPLRRPSLKDGFPSFLLPSRPTPTQEDEVQTALSFSKNRCGSVAPVRHHKKEKEVHS